MDRINSGVSNSQLSFKSWNVKKQQNYRKTAQLIKGQTHVLFLSGALKMLSFVVSA